MIVYYKYAIDVKYFFCAFFALQKTALFGGSVAAKAATAPRPSNRLRPKGSEQLAVSK